jgi:hypothetical protein
MESTQASAHHTATAARALPRAPTVTGRQERMVLCCDRVRPALLLCLVLAACGGGTSSGPAAPSPAGKADAGSDTTAPPGDPASPPRPLDEADCGRLFDHVVDVTLAEKRAGLKADEVPTDQQVAAIRQSLRAEGMATCLASPRSAFDCAMAADTTAGLRTCLAATTP